MLHQWISGDQFEGALMQGRLTIGWEKTPLGVPYNLIVRGRGDSALTVSRSSS